jgi:hypothetical protein
MTPEQEVRAKALELTLRLHYGNHNPLTGKDLVQAYKLAGHFAQFIQDGSVPQPQKDLD